MEPESIYRAKQAYEHFSKKEFRPGQEDAIRFASESSKPVVTIVGPTGSGKSLIGMITGEVGRNGDHEERFVYCASSKQLQTQLEDEFPEAMTMQGRRNFPCEQHRHLMADQCTHSKKSLCPVKCRCPYESHKRMVLAHPRQILNYHYLLTEANYVGQFSGYPLLVADEADLLEKLLTDFVGLTVTKRNLEELGIGPPKYKTVTSQNGLDDWIEWGRKTLLRRIAFTIDSLEDGLEIIPHTEVATKLQVMKSLEKKAKIFVQHVDDTWICEETKWNDKTFSFKFSPTWLSPELAYANFFGHADRVVMMSATFPPVHIIAKTLGLEASDIDRMELPSTFPVANRPVYLNPVANMSRQTYKDELPGMIGEIERLLAKHLHEKGMIHTHRWELNEMVLSIGNPRLVSHSSHNKQEALNQFLRSKDPLVWVSPSSGRGVDLPDDSCRFIIMVKAPFQDLSSKLVSNRVHGSQIGGWWYRSMCAQEIVQACGRAVRHEGDYAVAYLLDKQICEMVTDNQALFPKYWLKSVDIL